MASKPERVHHVKIWPEFFEAIAKGLKTFEYRLNDRDYRKGDGLVLREWVPETEMVVEHNKEINYGRRAGYTGRHIEATIGFTLEPRNHGNPTHTPYIILSLVGIYVAKD